MGVVIIKNKVSKKDKEIASQEYGPFIKVVCELETGTMAIGGEWHADAEKLLLENGFNQKSLWGGGVDLKTGTITTTALINIRPSQDNPSQEILDKDIRKKFTEIVKDKFEL